MSTETGRATGHGRTAGTGSAARERRTTGTCSDARDPRTAGTGGNAQDGSDARDPRTAGTGSNAQDGSDARDSRTAERAAALVSRWVRSYTWRLPAPIAERRIEEIDADLCDHIAYERDRGTSERRIALSVLSRMVRGLAADASWRNSVRPRKEDLMKSLAVSLVAALGVAAMVFGEYDDAPGLVLIGLLMIAGAAVLGCGPSTGAGAPPATPDRRHRHAHSRPEHRRHRPPHSRPEHRRHRPAHSRPEETTPPPPARPLRARTTGAVTTTPSAPQGQQA